jgi:molybdopterin-biosynthesis enzyme MoeA-like protein
MIFTCGGLGPTADDLTLAAVAEAAGQRLALNSTARDFIERRYEELASRGFVADARMNDARIKMAWLPTGALPVENPVGSAPATVLEARDSRIVSLPGVPAELKSIVEGPLEGLLNEVFGRGGYRERELTVRCGDESVLAPILRRVAAAHTDVYIKSRASSFGQDVRFRIMISASAESAASASRMIERAAADIARSFAEAGIQIDALKAR